MSTKYKINHDEKPQRLFKSDFLEFFTHISPVAVLVIFGVIIALFIRSAVILNQGLPGWHILLGILIGLVLWFPTEYILHRFLFHFQPKVMTPTKERLLFLMHGVHHTQPACKTRLVMPPVVSIPMAAVFYLLFWLVAAKLFGAPQYAQSIMAGFLIGYLIYDMAHYALHHINIGGNYWKKLKKHHMHHHFTEHDMRFGVSTWFYDVVFGTMPKEKAKVSSSAKKH